MAELAIKKNAINVLCQHHQIDKIVSFDPHFDRFLEKIKIIRITG